MLPILKIQDIIRLNRVNYKSNTTNKAHYVISMRLRGKSSFLYSGTEFMVSRGDVLYIPVEKIAQKILTAKGTNTRKRLQATEILAIDEISMIPADIFDLLNKSRFVFKLYSCT